MPGDITPHGRFVTGVYRSALIKPLPHNATTAGITSDLPMGSMRTVGTTASGTGYGGYGAPAAVIGTPAATKEAQST